MDKFLTLLDLQKAAREAGSPEAFGFSIVNATHKLVPYAQALFWVREHNHVRLKSASGNIVIDHQGEYVKALENFLEAALKDGEVSVADFSKENIGPDLGGNFAGHAINLVFKPKKKGF
jgi:hypothetical protein